MKIKIRKAERKDLDDILDMWRKYEKHEESLANLKKHPWVKKRKNAEENMRKNFSKVIKSKKAEIFIADIKKQIAGFILISKDKSDDIHNFNYYGSLHYMYVYPKFRGKKISSLLFKQAKKWFKSKKLKYMNLYVSIPNKKTRKIYKKWNFKEHEISMWRKL